MLEYIQLSVLIKSIQILSHIMSQSLSYQFKNFGLKQAQTEIYLITVVQGSTTGFMIEPEETFYSDDLRIC